MTPYKDDDWKATRTQSQATIAAEKWCKANGPRAMFTMIGAVGTRATLTVDYPLLIHWIYIRCNNGHLRACCYAKSSQGFHICRICAIQKGMDSFGPGGRVITHEYTNQNTFLCICPKGHHIMLKCKQANELCPVCKILIDLEGGTFDLNVYPDVDELHWKIPDDSPTIWCDLTTPIRIECSDCHEHVYMSTAEAQAIKADSKKYRQFLNCPHSLEFPTELFRRSRILASCERYAGRSDDTILDFALTTYTTKFTPAACSHTHMFIVVMSGVSNYNKAGLLAWASYHRYRIIDESQVSSMLPIATHRKEGERRRFHTRCAPSNLVGEEYGGGSA